MRLTACLAVWGMTILTAAGPTMAKDVLTLDDCIEMALQKRASIIAARGAENLANWNKVAALGAFLPQISAGYSYSKSKQTNGKSETSVTRAITEDTLTWQGQKNGVDTTLGTIQPDSTVSEVVEFPVRDQDRTNKSLSIRGSMDLINVPAWFSLAAVSADKARAHLDVIGSEQDLILSVKSAYYLYLAAVQKVTVDTQAVARSKEQLKLIQSKFDLGSASKSDVLKQKVLAGNDRLSLLASQNAVSTTRATLAYTIGIDPTSDVEFSTDYTVREYDGTLDDAMNVGLASKPSLLAARKSFDAARHRVRAQWAEYLPTLAGSASLSTSSGTQGDTLAYKFSSDSRSIGISLSWNIFDGFLRERNVASAKITRNNAWAQLADERNLTASTIQSAYLEIKRLKEQKSVAQENVDAASEDLKITQEKYNLGAATILDLLNAQVSLTTAQVSLIGADFDLNLAIAKLENAMGQM